MKNYKVFCADCKSSYEQNSSYKPYCCGVCSSDFIAVKINPQYDDTENSYGQEKE
jgi:hypothetical protein